MIFTNIIFVIFYVHLLLLFIFNNINLQEFIDFKNIESFYILDFYRELMFSHGFINLVLFIITILSFATHYSLFKRFSPRYRVFIAKKILKRIRSLSLSQGEAISYLRKIDPFVFEELLLTTFKENGFKIKRNKRYTGDGGSDGLVWLKNKKHHIQAKRYKNYINKSHMEDFIKLIKKEKTGGLFIHTGRTGKQTLALAKQNNIKIISGEKLYNLVIRNKKPFL